MIRISALLSICALLAACGGEGRAPDRTDPREVIEGEAGEGGVTINLREAGGPVRISEARVPGQPMVLIDPGHGGEDGGAVSPGGVREKDLTLAFAEELRDLLVERGRVRVALTRDKDATVNLEQRPQIARAIGADLFVSIHMDSAPNPEATGVTIYSLSDVASTKEAAALAAAERERVGPVTSGGEGAVEHLLTDLALRDQMSASAAFARRFLRRAGEGVPLRPTPHQFADFVVLRGAQTPGALVEAGYLTNATDAARLSSVEGRRPLVQALAEAIEADLAARGPR
ncbi:N-acetylmuramoyl-L-alanine amidase family protein [Sphingomicrobium clamense]|uniref:N-acetylmuramoyl-L-alanine amidase n=1 Tax=Sphingomicrobium clamense TaxID=2851013 RepID=A0ABS6V5Q9_9SPHN|nr:N-acetylmuramoyl-L-alanine amidase [Sphingomicrobium sp. B8]MBW0144532.1 N-acetylmuramoyl-L-alanine amidase [Sphingomicrobium sp. B8]